MYHDVPSGMGYYGIVKKSKKLNGKIRWAFYTHKLSRMNKRGDKKQKGGRAMPYKTKEAMRLARPP